MTHSSRQSRLLAPRVASPFLVALPDPRRLNVLQNVAKRLLDVLGAGAALLVLSPLLAAIALTIGVRSGWPIMIRQQRVGLAGCRFRLYKFRTLPVSTLKDGDSCWSPPQVRGWAGFLRRTGFDELPQLWNVLRGEMSLVGPRPERPLFADQFSRQFPRYSMRHQARPGITGWAQVHGLRGDTSIAQRLEHDLFYLRNQSLRLDLLILRMTAANLAGQVWHAVGQKGVHAA